MTLNDLKTSIYLLSDEEALVIHNKIRTQRKLTPSPKAKKKPAVRKASTKKLTKKEKSVIENMSDDELMKLYERFKKLKQLKTNRSTHDDKEN